MLAPHIFNLSCFLPRRKSTQYP